MQGMVDAADNEDIAHYHLEEDKIAKVQVLCKEESLLDKSEVATIKEIQEGEVSINVLNTGLDDIAKDNEGVSKPAEESTFNMDDLLSILDELWPIAEKRIVSIKQVSQSPTEDIKRRKK